MPRLAELASALHAELAGDGDFVVHGINHPSAAGPEDLALAMEEAALATLGESRARAAVLRHGCAAPDSLIATLHVEHPRYALATLTRLFQPPPHAAPGIHEMAVIDPTAEVAAMVSIGPFVQVGPGARIGTGAILLGQVTVGAHASIGANALIHPGVRIGERVRIGDRAILHHNASLGADGFSFAIPEPGTAPPIGEPAISRVASLGTVILGDDVEVGANSCIDRGTIEATTIGSGTKIDNLVMIGHNTQIGQNCLIAGRVGISGSCRIGDRVILAGGVGIADHVTIGDDTLILAAAQVGTYRVPPRSVLMGAPAVTKDKFFEQFRQLRRLKQLVNDVEELKLRVETANKKDET
jgi:UDP-3-O-[3-hydroxymyristoyl] glucosamine N-acyltransferase